jgi:hypothetical protein
MMIPLLPYSKSLACLLNISDEYMHREAKLNLCTSIHSPEILQILNAIPPENYLKLGGTLRTKLLFRIQELPPEKYFHSTEIYPKSSTI